jgi:hypothetical protein
MGRREGLTIYVLSCNLPACLPRLKNAYLDELLQTHTHAHTHPPICNCHPRRQDCSIARLPFSLTCLTRTSHHI